MPRLHLHKHNFRYENVWHMEPGFKELVTNSWKIHLINSIILKLSLCAEYISVWRKYHCNKFKIDIEECCRHMNNIRLNSLGDGQI